MLPFFWQILPVPIVRAVPHRICHKNVVNAWGKKTQSISHPAWIMLSIKNYSAVMNKALHFNEDSLITSQSSNIRIVLIQKVLMQLQRGTNAMIAELVFGEILIKFLEKF